MAASPATNIALLQVEVQRLSADVEALTKTIQTLVEHDVAIRTVIRLGTWLGALIAGLGGLWTVWRGH